MQDRWGNSSSFMPEMREAQARFANNLPEKQGYLDEVICVRCKSIEQDVGP